MNRFIFLTLSIILCFSSFSSIAQTKDSLLVDLLRVVDANEQFRNEFVQDTCCYNIVIKNDLIKEVTELNSFNRNKHIYITNDSLLKINPIGSYYPLVDFVHVKDTARLQLLNSQTKLVFSAFFEKKENYWEITSLNIAKTNFSGLPR